VYIDYCEAIMRFLTVVLVLCLAALACNMGVEPTARPTLLATENQNSVAQTATAIIAAATSNAGLTPAPNPGATTLPDLGGGVSTGTGGTPVGCVPRTNWSTLTVVDGDTLWGIALRVGATVDDLVQANCLANADALVVGQTLYVPNTGGQASGGNTYPGYTNIPVAPSNCGTAWFFTFTRGTPDTTCPAQGYTVTAVGQNFQGGRVYRYEAVPGLTTSPTIYIIYNDGTWEALPDTWNSTQPNDDPSVVPPETWYKPYGAIGKIWREQSRIREKLGWAYQPEAAFTGHLQTPQSGGGSHFYIAHGLRNLALRLWNGSQMWEVVGIYP
jgi:LysM repeat protein